MLKKLTAAVLVFTMSLTLAACGSQNPTQSESAESRTKTDVSQSENSSGAEEDIAGGWEINQGKLSLADNPEAKEAFEKATEELAGYEYEAVAFLGSQVVQGTNYSYLCKGTPVYPDAESEYLIVNVYEDLEGNTELTGTKGLLDIGNDDTDGGWSYNQESPSVYENTEVKAAFEKATEGLAGMEYEPVAYIGSQTVSGTNYAVFCSETAVVPDAERAFSMVTIYEDLDGNAEITDDQAVELSADLPGWARSRLNLNTEDQLFRSNACCTARDLEEKQNEQII